MKQALGLAASLVLAGMLGAAGNPAAAEGTPISPGAKCVSADAWANEVLAKSSAVSITVLADVDGAEAKSVVDRVNATPPQTHLSADHVIVLGAKSVATEVPAPYVLVAFFNQGCLVAAGRADPQDLADMLSGQST